MLIKQPIYSGIVYVELNETSLLKITNLRGQVYFNSYFVECEAVDRFPDFNSFTMQTPYLENNFLFYLLYKVLLCIIRLITH